MPCQPSDYRGVLLERPSKVHYRTTGVEPSLAGAKTTLPTHLPSGRPTLFELHRQGAPTVIELGTLQKPLCAKPVPLLVLVQKHNLAGAFGSDGCRPVVGTVICGTSTTRRLYPAGLSCAWRGEDRLTKLAASTAIRKLFEDLSMCVPSSRRLHRWRVKASPNWARV